MQGGSLFPTVIFVVCALGVGLIAYARQSQERVSALDTATQNYYTAFGIYKCDAFIDDLPAASDLATSRVLNLVHSSSRLVLCVGSHKFCRVSDAPN